MIMRECGLYWSGQVLAIGVGVIVGIDQSSWATGTAVMFALQLLVDIRHKEMK